VDFSRPYYHNKFTLLTIGDGNYENPIRDGMSIGVQTGTLMHQWIKKQSFDVKIISMDRNLELVEDLKNRRIDALLLDEISTKEIIKSNPSVNMSSIPLNNVNDSGISIALRKDSSLVKDINEAIAQIEESGEMQSLRLKWGL
jgi:ABC-type amino acid transport substrate-binding protein